MRKILLSIVATFCLTAITTAQNVPTYVPTNGLVGWWPFNGNANDESGNGNNGTVNGATITSDRFGNIGKAYNFDGLNDYIRTTYSGIIAQGARSISLWFNQDTIITGNMFQTHSKMILAGYGGNANYSNFTILINSANGGNKVGIDIQNSTNSSINVNKDLWYHLVVTYDPSFGTNLNTCKYYVNGLQTAITYSFNTNQNINTVGNSPLTFGTTAFLNSNTYDFWGKLDDIGIWNRALTPQEITNLYNGNICYQNITVTDTLLINMGITGFNPVTYQNTIKVWPNPTNDHITIDNGNLANLNGYQIKIMNSLSQQVFQSAITQQQFYINLSSWTGNGIYFVHIIDGQGNTVDVKKIILQ
jgi:hypothetical protein